MGKVKQFFSDLFAIFFMGVGISTTRTKQKKLDDRDTDRLFAYAEIESEELWSKIAQTEVCRRWWAHMRDLMLTNDDDSPVAINLDEVFHLD